MTNTDSNDVEESLVDDTENSVWFDINIGLEPKFNNLLDALTSETLIHHQLERSRPSSISQIRTTIDSLLANLIRAYLRGPAWFVAIPMATRDYVRHPRYRNRGIGYDNLRLVLAYLLERPEPHISLVEGVNSQSVTRIRASAPLLTLLSGENDQNDSTRRNPDGNALSSTSNSISPTTGRISLSHQSIVHTGSGDCIHLKGPKIRDERRPDAPAKAPLINYEDNAETEGMRASLTTWNTFIRGHILDLFVTDEDFEQIFDKKKRKIDLTRTYLYRVFNNSSFEQGGRCYGGWWQGVPKKWRPYITIDNSPTRELDYSSLHPVMLYQRKGLSLPTDAYAIEGIDLTDILDQRDRDYCIAKLRSRWSVGGIDVWGAGGR